MFSVISTNTLKNPEKCDQNKKKSTKKKTVKNNCHMSPVTYHLSPATATDPPFANFPIMHSRVVPKDQKHIFFYFSTQKLIKKAQNNPVILNHNFSNMPFIPRLRFIENLLFRAFNFGFKSFGKLFHLILTTKSPCS